MKIAGLDIGTSGCKLTVFDSDGKTLNAARAGYPLQRHRDGCEIDLNALMEGVESVIRRMSALYPDLSAIGVTSFGETFVMTDEAGRPLHVAMLYTDPRGQKECRRLTDALGAEQIARITGVRPHEMYSISKMLFIRQNRPEIYARARHIFLVQDYVVWQLTGNAQIDYSLAARTMAFDIRRLAWSGEIFAAAGIDPALMSSPVPSGTIAGCVSRAAARRFGLSEQTRIVSVSHDQVAAAVGAGAFDSSVAVDGAGSTECLTPVYDKAPPLEGMIRGHFSLVPYVLPGKYVAYAFSYTGGALISWALETFGQGMSHEKIQAACPDAPTGLLVLPHFAGAATPYMDTGSRGAILGLDTRTSAPELYRACMEGVAYELRLNYEALLDSGISFQSLNAAGGGARSRVWTQMKADILNLPITSLKTPDAGTVGSAMLTGTAIGLFASLHEAKEAMTEKERTYEPRPAMHERYLSHYARYKGLYRAVRPLMEDGFQKP